MGLGFAIMEQIEFDKRAEKPSSSDLLHYRIPTALDMPGIHVYIAKGSYEPTGPLWGKKRWRVARRPCGCGHCECDLKSHRRADRCTPLNQGVCIQGASKGVKRRREKRILPMLRGMFSYEAPESLDQAVNTLMTEDNITLLAGGTDLISLIKYGVKKPSSLLDLKKIPSLKSIALRDEGLRSDRWSP